MAKQSIIEARKLKRLEAIEEKLDIIIAMLEKKKPGRKPKNKVLVDQPVEEVQNA
jgi:hypothetical protein